MHIKGTKIAAFFLAVLFTLLSGCGGGGEGGSAGGNGDNPTPPNNSYATPEDKIFPGSANDVTWDSSRQVLYVTLSRANGPSGNVVAALDPKTLKIIKSTQVGGEPQKLALTDDGQYLYVSVDSTSTVHRLKLPSLESDLIIHLGNDPSSGQNDASGGPFLVKELVAVPAHPKSVIVTRGNNPWLSYVVDTVVYDDTTMRPKSLSAVECLCDSLQWSEDGKTIYAADNESSAFRYYKIALNDDGLSLISTVWNVFERFGSKIHYDKNTKLIYSDSGVIFNPATESVVTKINFQGPMVPDTERGMLHYVTATGTSAVTSLDYHDYTQIKAAQPINEVAGMARKIIRWGENGLAIVTGIGATHILGGSGTATFQAAIPEGNGSHFLIAGSFNQAVFDATRKIVYATTSTQSTTDPNSVLAIDPATGEILFKRQIGNAPNSIAVSEDGIYLYVGLDEIHSIRRLTLPSLSDDIDIPMGEDEFGKKYSAGDIQIQPGKNNVIAVTRFQTDTIPKELGGIVIYDNETPRPQAASNQGVNYDGSYYYTSLAWNKEGNRIYASGPFAELYTLTVDSSGVHQYQVLDSVFLTSGKIHLDGADNIIYGDPGNAVNPDNFEASGIYRPTSFNGPTYLATDAINNRIYALWADLTQSGSVAYITVFDKENQSILKTYGFPFNDLYAYDLIKTGSTRFAYLTGDGLHLVQLTDIP